MNPIGVSLRLAAIAVVVFTFVNPTSYCFVMLAWYSIAHTPDTVTVALPYLVLGLAVYLCAAAYLVRATHNGIGVWGVLLAVIFLGALTWVADRILHMHWNKDIIVWAMDLGVTAVLWFGLIYPALNRRLSGQVTTTQGAAIDAHVHHG